MNYDFDVIPPFANELVKRKFAELNESGLRLDGISAKEFELLQRIKKLEAHAVDVAEQLRSSQELIELNNDSSDQQAHDVALWERHVSLIESQATEVRRDTESTNDLLVSLQDQIRDARRKRDRIMSKHHVTATELANWQSAHQESLLDEEAISQYSKEDSQKLKTLRTNLAILVSKKAVISQSLEGSTSQGKGLRIELEGLAEQLKQLKSDRDEDLSELEKRMAMVATTDQDLERLATEYVESVSELNSKEVVCKNLQYKLDGISHEISTKESELTDSEKNLAVLQKRLKEESSELAELDLQLDSENFEHKSALDDVARSHARLDSAILSVERAKTQLETIRANFDSQEQRLSSIVAGKLSKEKQAAEAQKVLTNTIGAVTECESQIKGVKDSLLTESERLDILKLQEKNLLIELSSVTGVLRGMPLKVSTQEGNVDKVRDRILATEYEIEVARRQLEALAGHVSSDSERKELIQRTAELEKQLREAKSVHALLASQLRKQETELKSKRRACDEFAARLASTNAGRTAIESEIEKLERSTSQLVSAKDQLLLARDDLTASINLRRDEVGGIVEELLAKQAEYGEVVEAESGKAREVDGKIDELQGIVKRVGEERHMLATRIGGVRSIIAQLEVKYDHLVRRRTGVDEDDVRGQARALLKAAQAREGLNAEAEAVEKELKECMQEVTAMQFAVKSLHNGNIEFASALRGRTDTPSDGGREVTELAKIVMEGQKELEGVRVEVDELRRKVGVVGDELKAAGEGHDKKLVQVEELKVAAVGLEGKFESVKSELESMRTRCDESTYKSLIFHAISSSFETLKRHCSSATALTPELC